MKFLKKLIMPVILTGLCAFVPTQGAATVVRDEGLPKNVIAYLKSKEVSAELRAELDKVFCTDKVRKAFDTFYPMKSLGDYDQLLKNRREARETLEQEGFHFLVYERVFRHRSFPQYVFKIGLGIGQELLNATRIRRAQELTENNDKIWCPFKQAYMPYAFRFTHEREFLPIVIVVADWIHDWSALDFVSGPQRKFLEAAGYEDGHNGNARSLGNEHILIIDTETITQLNYPQHLQIPSRL